MILEAILGVRDPSSASGVRFAPMGAAIPESGPLDRVVLRPFSSSRTGALLLREGRGVLNFTDDVFLFAQSALTDEPLPSGGPVLDGACEWWEIEVADAGEEQAGEVTRRSVSCLILERRAAGTFAPFNRARNAVLEAAILATRARLDDSDENALRVKMRELGEIVLKTGGGREIAAFDLIRSKL